jgi:CRP-like cAMP-binding protein
MGAGQGPADDNRLLASLPSTVFTRMSPSLERVRLVAGNTLYEAGSTIDHAWFLTSGIVSLLAVAEDGGVIEVASIGREGLVGLPGIIGRNGATTRARVQISGEALRIQIKLLQAILKQVGGFYEPLFQYTYIFSEQILLTAACNQFHTAEQRLARWLLTAHDQVSANTLDLTHDSLSQVLGVSRSRVSLAAEELQRKGVIHYLRGRIHTVNREGLEDAACECYQSIRETLNGHSPT